MNGFFEGRAGIGLPSAPNVPGGGVTPEKAKKFEGVSAVASAGGGRPESLARRVRAQRMRV